jgi:hypothetical protein
MKRRLTLSENNIFRLIDWGMKLSDRRDYDKYDANLFMKLHLIIQNKKYAKQK